MVDGVAAVAAVAVAAGSSGVSGDGGVGGVRYETRTPRPGGCDLHQTCGSLRCHAEKRQGFESHSNEGYS